MSKKRIRSRSREKVDGMLKVDGMMQLEQARMPIRGVQYCFDSLYGMMEKACKNNLKTVVVFPIVVKLWDLPLHEFNFIIVEFATGKKIAEGSGTRQVFEQQGRPEYVVKKLNMFVMREKGITKEKWKDAKA